MTLVERIRRAAIFGVLIVLSACTDDITQPKILQLKHGEPNAGPGDGGHVIPAPECKNACCPDPATAPECYFGGKNPSDYSGAECMAQLDNTTLQRWQLRQTQSISTFPPGNADPIVGGILLARSQLHSDACKTDKGQGGFIQLVELDLGGTENVARTGFAAMALEQSEAVANGLCFAEDTYRDDAYALPSLYDRPADWPKGLPAPMSLSAGWKYGPVKAFPYPHNFSLKTERDTILSDIAARQAEGYGGIFFLDRKKGYMHGYAPLGFVVTYDVPLQTPPTYNAIPIREAEITSQINDPDHPNCSGVYGENPIPEGACTSTTALPAWSCPGGCAPGEYGPTKTEGYFLIAEAEQVHLRALKQTLCYRMPNKADPDWPVTADPDGELKCRNNSNWKSTDPVKGMPHGDWCAATNSPAQGDCHDAWRSVSYSTSQAFPIRENTCPAF